MQRLRKVLGFLLWVLVPFLAASVGALFGPDAWYESLAKPALTPPGYVFGPVWTMLYATMGVAAWMVWSRKGFSGARWALGLFFAQLLLNGAWTWLFFGLHLPLVALVDIVLLWALILLTLIAFWRIRRAAGALLIPYLAWVSFAALLNAQFWWLNR